jgi:DNA replication protein DnaC
MGECEPTAEDLQLQLEQRRREAAKDHAPTGDARRLGASTASTPPPAMDPAAIEARQAVMLERERRAEMGQRASRWENLLGARGSRYADAKLTSFTVTDPKQQPILEQLRDYQANILERIQEGDGLILFGPKGTGKDHLAMAMARTAIGAGRTVVWKNGMDLFGDFRDAMDKGDSEKSMVKELVNPDVLYLSDPLPPIGPLTPYQATMVFRILDGRYNHRRTTWVTVNVTGSKELDDRMGAQNGDRIRDGAMALFCDWASYRRVKG